MLPMKQGLLIIGTRQQIEDVFSVSLENGETIVQSAGGSCAIDVSGEVTTLADGNSGHCWRNEGRYGSI
jgi:hypothetical protein